MPKRSKLKNPATLVREIHDGLTEQARWLLDLEERIGKLEARDSDPGPYCGRTWPDGIVGVAEHRCYRKPGHPGLCVCSCSNIDSKPKPKRARKAGGGS